MRKMIVAILVLVGCGTDATDAIPGDNSPDNPGAPPIDVPGGKGDGPLKRVKYNGGVVMTAPVVVNVYWGAYWDTDAGTQVRAVSDGLAADFNASSEWWGVTSEYPDKALETPSVPEFDSAVVIDGSEPPHTLTDGAVTELLAVELRSGAIAYEEEAIYVVYTPPHHAAGDAECGYHSYVTVTLDGVKHKAIYAVVPYLPDPSCGVDVTVNGLAIDAMTTTVSHEVAEAATDPYLNAWGGFDGNEIGDQCWSGFHATWNDHDYVVQDLWSNSKFACVH
jgi:hypothetical protein